MPSGELHPAVEQNMLNCLNMLMMINLPGNTFHNDVDHKRWEWTTKKAIPGLALACLMLNSIETLSPVLTSKLVGSEAYERP